MLKIENCHQAERIRYYTGIVAENHIILIRRSFRAYIAHCLHFTDKGNRDEVTFTSDSLFRVPVSIFKTEKRTDR